MIKPLFLPVYFPKESLRHIKNIEKNFSHPTMHRFFWSLKETVKKTIENKKEYEKVLLAVFAVGLATSFADKDFSENEEKVLEEYLEHVFSSDMTPAIKRQFILLKKSFPDAQLAFSHVKKLPNFIPVTLFETVIEAIATADGFFCMKEKELLDQFRLEMGRLLSIPVIATMSSGKSTFINAMLGISLLPAQNEACTATVMKVENLGGQDSFWGRQTTPQKGVSDWAVISRKTLNQWNAEADQEIEILGNFCNIANNHAQICLHDTPGPNNSMDKSHAAITIDLLKKGNFGCVICVLNAEQFGIEDERELLKKIISNTQRVTDKNSKDTHIIFVLNKFDSLDPEKESGIEFIRKVATHITEVTGLSSPVIIPAMSNLCLSLRELVNEHEQTGTTSMSERKQRNLLQQIKFMESNWKFYAEIFESLSNIHLCDQNENCEILQLENNFLNVVKYFFIHNIKKMQLKDFFRKIKLGDEYLDINQIKKIELLTGIPFVEKVINDYITAKNRQDLMEKERNTLEVEISYNPYRVQTEIKINGELENNIFSKYKNKRLLDRFDSFLEEIINEYRENEIALCVHCTPYDADDVRDSVKQFNENHPKSIIYLDVIEESEYAQDKTEQLNSLTELLKLLLEKSQTNSFDVLKDEKKLRPDFEVHVVAAMSSGKSTIINAILGQEMMPTRNAPCTATIIRIEHCDGMTEFKGQRKNAEGKILEEQMPVDQETLTRWNDDKDTTLITLKGNIESISETESARLILVDTPGPNNSRDVQHHKTTMDAINNELPSMVLYVLNATGLTTTDDNSLLRSVAKAMESGGRQAQDRFVFIANKIDMFDPEKGESVTSALENVRTYLQHNGINDPKVIPVSAELAKLIRMKKNGNELKRKQKGELRNWVELFVEEPEMNMVQHLKGHLSSRCYNNLLQRIEDAQTDEEKAEIFSGIPIVEALLDEFIKKYVVSSKREDSPNR